MNFSDAFTALLNGDYITRDGWDSTGEYAALMPGMNSIWKITFQPNPNAANWLILVSDLQATDYKVVNVAALLSLAPAAGAAVASAG